MQLLFVQGDGPGTGRAVALPPELKAPAGRAQAWAWRGGETWHRLYPPARCGGNGRLVSSRGFGMATAPQSQNRAAMAFGSELQAPAGRQIEAVDFADDDRDAACPDGFFHHPKGFLVAACRHQQQSARIDPASLKADAIKILMRANPQTGAVAGQSPRQGGGKESRQNGLFLIEAGAGDFMQGVTAQAAAEMPVHRHHAEGNEAVGAQGRRPARCQLCELVTEHLDLPVRRNGGCCRVCLHVLFLF